MRLTPGASLVRAWARSGPQHPSHICSRHLSSTTDAKPDPHPTAASAPTNPIPLVRPFHPSHLDTPTWSTRTYLPHPTTAPPALPPGLLARLAHLSYLRLPVDGGSGGAQLERDIAAMIGHISYIRRFPTTHPPVHSPLQLMHGAEAVGAAGERVGKGEEGEVGLDGECVGVVSRTSEDVVSDGGDAELVLRNARYTNRGFFVVPKVVDLDV